MNSLAAIRALESGNMQILRQERWLRHIALTKERRVNLEHVQSLAEIAENPILQYTKKTLLLLQKQLLVSADCALLEEVLCWCEVAKAGMPHQRQQWLQQGYNLFAHNIGSAQIYREQAQGAAERKHLVALLIETHGLVGQYIRGEVPLCHNRPLYDLAKMGILPPHRLKGVLLALNACIIGAVSPQLWAELHPAVEVVIDRIATGAFPEQETLPDRMKKLRKISIAHGEDFALAYGRCLPPEQEPRIDALIRGAALWYVEAALYDFTLEEFCKIFLLIAAEVSAPLHISFEPFMHALYYEHKGQKRVNLYKKRVIEKYLSAHTLENIADRQFQSNPHVQHHIFRQKGLDDTVFFDFAFSPAGEKLIAFCVEAENAGVLYEQAVLMLFDLFGLRRDQYDRFYNEESYLDTMNQAVDHKRTLLGYITGGTVLDIGPGGGGLMDLIAKEYPEKKVMGIDFSKNVIERLAKRKQLEGRAWQVLYGDALRLGDSFSPGSVDTIIFCSVLHELFSYLEHEGKRFQHHTVAKALRSAFAVLPPGGRILIRDGIMTEPREQPRIIRFRSAEGLAFLRRYAQDFSGRAIRYEITGQNEVRMPVNDAMEFLYTYTWGEESYVHEVNEQFGYFTPSEYLDFIRKTLGSAAKIIESRHFLQDGYATALAPKIEFLNEHGNAATLPDSTCIIVIEKDHCVF